MTERTYGTYEYIEGSGKRGTWALQMEPAVAMRAKRLFTRAIIGVKGRIELGDSHEVCRDLEWFLQRYPLRPVGSESEARLAAGSTAFTATEQLVASVISGGTTRLKPIIKAPLKTARPYQQKAIDLMHARKRYLLTDELGLGKTVTGLLSINTPETLPALVVAPTHLVSRWQTEIAETVPHLSVHVAETRKVPEGILNGELADITIITYSKLDAWQFALQGRIRAVLADEAQEVRKGRGTNKGSALGNISDAAEYVMGLTATPVYNMGGEIWSVLDIIAQGELGTSSEFGREWGTAVQNGVRVTDPAALGAYLREHGLMFGHTLEEVGRELPPAVPVYVDADVDDDTMERLRGDAAEMARMILDKATSRKDRFHAAGELDWKLRQATGLAKAPFTAEYVRTLLTMRQNVVLFGWHRAVYDLWQELLAEFNPVLFTGSETAKQKDAGVAKFTSGESRVLIMSLRSGAGLDGLQHVTQDVVQGELDWSPEVHKQGIGRVRRDGMDVTRSVVVHWVMSNTGSDPVISEMLGLKRQQVEPMMSKDGQLTSVSAETREMGRGQALARYILGDAQADQLIADRTAAREAARAAERAEKVARREGREATAA